MRRRQIALVWLALAAPLPAVAQDGGVGPAPTEARAVLAKAVRAMGGKKVILAAASAVMKVEVKAGKIQEKHTLRVEGRLMHYASRRASGAGFDVVVGNGQGFLCDRSKKGKATYVETLSKLDTQEGAYERDILFMPLLLATLLKDGAKMDYRGRNSVGDEVVRVRISPTLRAKKYERPFTIRLRFDKQTHLLVSAMGIVPRGHDKGKKRYCVYEEYRVVRTSDRKRRKILMPHRISDQRGKAEKARTFNVSWKLNVKLSPSMFVRPTLERAKPKPKKASK